MMIGLPYAALKRKNLYSDIEPEPREEEDKSKNGVLLDKRNDPRRIQTRETCLVSPMRINHRAQIDVIDIADGDNNALVHVLIYEEQYSKFIVLRVLRSADPKTVANELVDIVTTIGAPRIIQSANGRDYAEQVVREIRLLLRDFCVVHGDASKNVESRRDFRSILNSWIETNPGRNLPDALRTIQVSENTSNSRDGKIPSQLFFARNICEDLRRTIGAKGTTTTGFFHEKGSREESSNLDRPISKEFDETSKIEEPRLDGPNVKTETLETTELEVEKEDSCTKNDVEKRNEKFGSLVNRPKTRETVHECKICQKSFRLSSLYERHLSRFHSDIAVPNNDGDHEKALNSTGRRKISKCLRIRESRVARSNDDLECSYCKQKFNFPSVLKRHVRSHTNERPYVCEVCKKSFKQLGHLSQHALTHTDYRAFNCLACALKFDTIDELRSHELTHRETRNRRTREISRIFECDDCKKIFTTKSVLERHIGTHTHERQYACDICGKRFKQAGHVKSHMLVHTGERKFSCSVCSRRFSLANSLKKHMYVHNGDKPYQCDICGSRFLEKRNLNGHLMTHTNERPFSCKICGKRYTLADTLRRHVSAAHEDGRTYQCEICAKMFKQLAHLSVHKKVHNDERPFQCHLCEKNFKHKNVLKSHLAIHANVRPFECDSCKSTFVRKTNLQTHIASAHMNERPYVCTICNKRFKQISHLNGHIVVHSNSMPYQCNFCDRRCNRLDNLKKHMRLHDKNKE